MYRDGLGHPGDTQPTSLSWRCGLVASIGATMLLADRVATATGTTSGWFGRLLAHGDVGAAVVLVAFTVGVLTPWIADPQDGRSVDRTAIIGWLRRGAVIVYSLWLITVVAAIAALHPTTSGRQLLSTLVAFRPVGSGTILTGLGIGPLVLEMVLIGAAAPFLGRFLRAPTRRIAGRDMSPTVIAVLLAGAGLAIRLVVIASGHRSPTGPLSTLPADLDLVGAGIAIALWVQPTRVDPTSRTRRTALTAGAIAAAAFVAMAVAITQPRVPGSEGGGSLFIQTALGTVVAASITFAVISSTSIGRWPRAVRWIALMAPGLLLFHETLFTVFARQYVDRITTDVLGVHLVGAAFPPFLWAFLVSVAIGLALAALVLQPLALALGTRVASNWFTLTSAGVVALGFVWRVIALLTIAPAKVDGGDPLFYHTTANTLAAGRGFPEPLHWIAYGTELKSAVHGPLFPLVLSFFSRMGGTTYFDHRMAAALIGAVVVLGVVLVGNAIAGRTVAVIAGVIASFYPNLWLIDGVLFPEGLMAALVVFTILAAYRWNDRPGWKLAAALGALVGLTALARGEGVLLMVLLVAPLILRNKTLVTRERLKQFGLACVACLLVMAPWTIRNIRAFEVFVPLSTNSNEVLMYANCNDAYHGKFIGFWVFDCQERIREAKGDPPGDEAQKAAYWRAIGLDYIKDHKGQLPEVILARVGRQWDVFRPWQNAELAPIEGRNENGARVGLFAYYALVAFGINGVRLLRKRRVKLLPLTSQLLSVTITAAAAYGTARFRAPAEPVLCLLAAVGVAPLLIRLRTRAVVRRDEDVPISDPGAFVLGGRAVRKRWSWPTFAGVGVVAFIALLPVRGMYHSTGGTMEEGFMLSFPERILKGAVPNVDFLHLYGPGSLDVLALWYRIFGLTLGSERTFGLLQHLAIIAGLYGLARAWGRGAACVTAAMSVFLILTPIGLTAMAWNGGVALGLWSVVFAVRSRNVASPKTAQRMLIVSGLLTGLALTYRPDLIVALVLVHGWLLWRRSGWKPFGVGGVVGLLPILVHVARIGPGTAIRTMLIDPVVKLRPGRELPRPPSWSHLDGALQAIAETVPPWWRFPAIAPSHQLFLWFFALPLAALLVVGTGIVLHRRTAGSPRSIVLTAAG
ncbi:MAG: hypothetical protein JWL72_556, partial [Ilumatobacteraceae bacterium]|nr:hypothetical protein [Ilumatobacteraceae bacterium]